ncbi:hypothetical protein ScPMuIL_018601 [Solemya velum]
MAVLLGILVILPMVLTQDCNPVLRIFNMASSMENMCGFTLEDRTCFTVTVATADGCSISNEKHYYYIYSIKSANDSQPSLKMNNEKIANIGQPVATCMREDDGFNTDSVYMINTTAVITANNEKFKMRFTGYLYKACKTFINCSWIKNTMKTDFGIKGYQGVQCDPTIGMEASPFEYDKTINETCYMMQDCNYNVDLDCLGNICTCDDNRYWTGSKCEFKKSRTESCLNTLECIDGLECTGDKCSCAESTYLEDYKCKPKKSIGGSCSDNGQCISSAGLQCVGGACSCLETSYWDQTCKLKKSIDGACSDNGQCISSAGLQCVGGACSCLETSYWDQTCKLKKSHTAICYISVECKSTEGLECIGGKCSCPDSAYWSNTQCEAKKSVGGACSQNVHCNNAAGLQCVGNMCSCLQTSYWDETCKLKKSVGVACSDNGECASSAGLQCVEETCSCPETSYWDEVCELKKSYTGICSSSVECKGSVGLECIVGECSCADTAYWDNTACEPKKSYTGICSSSVECKGSVGLECINGECSCADSAYWDNTACEPKKSYNKPCSSHDQCDHIVKLQCNDGRCSCPESFYWDNTCLQLKSFSDSCDNNAECDDSFGLLCTESRCSCLEAYYWDNNCEKKKSHAGTCSDSGACRSTEELECIGGECACPVISYWNDDDTICKLKKYYKESCKTSKECDDRIALVCTDDEMCDCPFIAYWENEQCVNYPPKPAKIICIQNCLKDLDEPINLNQDAVFSVDLDKSEGHVTEISWTAKVCEGGKADDPVKCTEVLRTIKGKSKEFTFQYSVRNQHIEVEAEVTYMNGNVQIPQTYVYAEDIPHGGSCEVVPVSGFAETTEYLFTCSRFEDQDKPLNYEFFVQSDISIETKGVSLGVGSSASNLKKIVQSHGKVDNLYRLTVLITDSVGSSYSFVRNFEVLPYKKEAAGIHSAMKNIQAESDNENVGILDTLSGVMTDISSNLEQVLNGTERELTGLLKTVASSLNIDQQRDTTGGVDDDGIKKDKRIQLREVVLETMSNINVSGVSVYQVQELGTVLKTVTEVPEEVSDESQSKATGLYSNLAETFEDGSTNTTVQDVKDTVNVLMTGVISLLDISSDSGRKKVGINETDMGNHMEAQKETTSVDNTKKNSLQLIDTIEKIFKIELNVKEVGEAPSVYETDDTSVAVQALNTEQLAGKALGVAKNSSNDFSKATFLFPNSSDFVSNIAGLSDQSIDVGLQMMFSKQNTYFWDNSSRSVNSPMISVNLKNRTNKDDLSVRNLSTPVLLSFANKEKETHAFSMALVSLSGEVEELTNESKAIFQMNVSSQPMGKFILSASAELENISMPIRVLVQGDYEPSLEDIVINGTFLPKNESVLTSDGDLKEDNSMIFVPIPQADTMYIGVALDTTVLSNEFYLDTVLQYINCNDFNCKSGRVYINGTLEIYSSACVFWNDTEQTWSEEGCMIAPYTSRETLYCWCTHLTAFSSSFLIMPNVVSLKDIMLFSTFFSNPVVVITIVIVWIIYFILLYWARREDRKDVFKGSVYALQDNKPGNMYMYLVCVITRWWTAAGTTANVFLQLKGNDDYSARHCLSDIPRKCFLAGSEDWFLITTPRDLGDLASVQVWHDSTGESPSWFLNRVIVKDLQTSKSWTFLFNEWLAADRGIMSTRVEILALTAESEQLFKKTNFLFMSSRSLRDTHLWLSVFSKSPTSTFTRVQRLSCALCLLLSSMLVTIMFHGIPTDDPDDQLKYGDLHISLTDVVIGIQASILLFPINFLILQLFLKLAPRPPKEKNTRLKLADLINLKTKLKDGVMKKRNILFGQSQPKHAEDGGKKSFKMGSDSREDILLAVSDLESTKAKAPWRLPWWFFYVAWFLVISTSLICSFFTMLYGLKYGYRKSVDWLVSFLTAFFQNNTFMEPLKVVVVAFILTIFLKKSVEVENENENKDLDKDEEYVQDIDKTVKEDTSTPAPLSKKILRLIEQRLKIDAKVFDTINDMVYYFTYLFIVLFIVHGHRPVTAAYLCNSALENALFNPLDSSDNLVLEGVSTATSFWEYIHGKIVPNLASMANPDTSVVTATSNFILVGPYRFRQLRVIEGSCYLPHQRHFGELANLECLPPYWQKGEDTLCYNGTWSAACSTPPASKGPWQYQTGWELQTLPYIGTYGTYSGGGYVVEVPTGLDQSRTVLESIQNSDWIDDRTRVIFLEFTLYNPNVDLFSVFLILFEFPNTGSINPSYKIFTSKLFHYTNGLEIFVAVCEVFFIICTIAFTYREIKRYRMSESRKIYFTDTWRYVEVVQISLSYAVIGLFIQRALSVNQILKQHKESSRTKFVSFFTAVSWDFLLGYTMAALVGLVIVKAFKLFEFNRRTFMLIDTLRYARNQVFHFSIMTFLFLSAFTSFAVVMFGPFLSGYRSISATLLTLLNLALGASDFVGLSKANAFFGPIFFFLFIFFVQWTFLTMFVAIIDFSISYSHDQASKRKNELEFIDYFWEKASSLLPYTENKQQDLY